MFAVIQVGSTQYVVQEKEEFLVDSLSMKEGENFMVEKVLLAADDKDVQVGTPYLSNVKVETRVMGEEKGEKIRVFKMKAKKRYERTRGHRSVYTRLKVLKISVLKGKAPAAKKEAPKKPAAKKAPTKKAPAKKEEEAKG